MFFSSSAARGLCVVFVCILLLGAGGLYVFFRLSDGAQRQDLRYPRAVFVLQSLFPQAADEEETIPARVAYDDDTESLFHHPDKIFVLRHVADELAAMGAGRPKAPLFEAYARIALGEREAAVQLLTRYVVENEYNAAHYALLCANLHELGDALSLLLICREWGERDVSCREERVRYTFTALYNLGRHGDAAACLAKEGACLGWQAAVYEAKLALAQGRADEAEAVLQKAREAFSNEALPINRMWEQVKDWERL